jgi:hypothetical protein
MKWTDQGLFEQIENYSRVQMVNSYLEYLF